MKPIQMVDLVGQYEKIKPQVDAALLNVLGSAAFINGPEVKAFEWTRTFHPLPGTAHGHADVARFRRAGATLTSANYSAAIKRDS